MVITKQPCQGFVWHQKQLWNDNSGSTQIFLLPLKVPSMETLPLPQKAQPDPPSSPLPRDVKKTSVPSTLFPAFVHLVRAVTYHTSGYSRGSVMHLCGKGWEFFIQNIKIWKLPKTQFFFNTDETRHKWEISQSERKVPACAAAVCCSGRVARSSVNPSTWPVFNERWLGRNNSCRLVFFGVEFIWWAPGPGAD